MSVSLDLTYLTQHLLLFVCLFVRTNPTGQIPPPPNCFFTWSCNLPSKGKKRLISEKPADYLMPLQQWGLSGEVSLCEAGTNTSEVHRVIWVVQMLLSHLTRETEAGKNKVVTKTIQPMNHEGRI